MQRYSVKQVAKMSGVSVRSLHLYDEIGLLKPAQRSDAGYRFYGETELLRLQQILFFKELGFPLAQVKQVLEQPEFELLKALEWQKKAFLERRAQMEQVLQTIDQTILHLKNKGVMSNVEWLYRGISKEQAEAWRKEASEKWGDAVEKSEKSLNDLSQAKLEELVAEQKAVGEGLFQLRHLDPQSSDVQAMLVRHYQVIRAFWGTTGHSDKQAAAYAGLGNLFLADERYTTVDGVPQPEFARFLQAAMAYFSETRLK
jgi:DNA-binding transcriptional MerR regulator